MADKICRTTTRTFCNRGGSGGGAAQEPEVIQLSELKLGGILFPPGLWPKTLYLLSQANRGGRTVLAKKKAGAGALPGSENRPLNQIKGGKMETIFYKQRCSTEKAIPQLSKMLLTKQGHAVVLKEGEYRYIATLKVGLEFP